ncbi:MAG: bifunctional diaminohydroxyphosphoribosylaminopyrimidine deaminase/5-amino-6-(5-phosphoribosylamino)uracil reductase RibD [Gammaproteobacteria bacterium]
MCSEDVCSEKDTAYLMRAVALAEQGLFTTDPNPRVGCVLCHGDTVVGEGLHWRAGDPHAEVHALVAAGDRARGATAYVTLEPCSHFGRTPPCADALIQAGVSRVVVGMTDPNPRVAGRGLQRLRESGIAVALCETETKLQAALHALNPGYLQRMRTGRPWVRVKLAASMDGRTALANGESQWITGAAARADVHNLRARSSAIVTGIGTVLADNASLTVRPAEHQLDYPEMNAPFPFADRVRQPLRVVLDSRFRLSRSHRICQQPGQTVIVGCSADRAQAMREATSRRAVEGEESGAEDVDALPVLTQETATAVEMAKQKNCRVVLPVEAQRVSVRALMGWLGMLGMNEVLIEAGPTLAGACVAAGVVDELWLYQAPLFLGADARPLLQQLQVTALSTAPRWRCASVTMLGDDVRLVLTPRLDSLSN